MLEAVEESPDRKPIERLKKAKVLCSLEMLNRPGLKLSLRDGKLNIVLRWM